ncbi:hypothetical protein [Beduini massiliensis]|uniref:hypothetical protein n=1 Tax=Beduini massiliensis TaxID=1585974 RepID=UPI0011C77D65
MIIICIQSTAILLVFIDTKIDNKYLNKILPFTPILGYIIMSALVSKYAPPFNIISFLLLPTQLIVTIYNESKKKSKQ